MEIKDLNIVECMRYGFDDYIEDNIHLYITYDKYANKYLIGVAIIDQDRYNCVLLSFKEMFNYRHEFHNLINSLIYYAQ